MKLSNKNCKIILRSYKSGGPTDIIIKFDDGKEVNLSIAKGGSVNPYPNGLIDECIEEFKRYGGSLDKEEEKEIKNQSIVDYVFKHEYEIEQEYLRQ
jgi:hypothetical protein